MRKNYIFTFLFIALLMTGCQTTSVVSPYPGDEELAVETIDPMDVSITINADENIQEIFDRAIKAHLRHDWETAIELLADAHMAFDSTHTTIFQGMIEALRFNPKSADVAFATLDRIDRVSPGIALEKSLWEAYPFRLEWQTDTVLLPLVTRDDVGWINRLTYPRHHPVVEVVVNGVPMRFILDTGANRNMLFSRSARRAGIETFSSKAVQIDTSNDKDAAAQIGVIEHMQLGGLHIHNDLVFIVDRPLFVAGGVDGFIGWTVLSQLVMEFDRAQDTIRLYPEFPEKPGITNYTWLMDPMIVLHRSNEVLPLYFFLDTGANATWFSPAGRKELEAEITDTGHIRSYGLGGGQKLESQTINLDGLFLDRKELVFQSHNNSGTGFFFDSWWHGLIGYDIARAGLVRFNFPAGRVIFEPYTE